jgi:hypothetical protein
MTMKAILLGTAAGLMAVGAAHAADLPMTKAEAVEYVRVCTEFGEGFFYIPGTDTCLKIAGEVRADYQFDSRDNRLDDVTAFDSEARVKWDARTATEYGTLRSFIQINVNYAAGTTSTKLDKAFIQWGPITAGKAHSFFGMYDADYANTIFAGYFGPQSDANLFAYTAVFGGGFSATLSIEDGRDHRSGLVEEDLFVASAGTYGGQSMPDIVGNVRVDQGWGKVMLSGAVHEIRYPTDDTDADYGWAVALGGAVDLSFLAGGYIALEAAYAHGAGDYINGPHEAAYSVAPGSYGETDRRKGWSVTGEVGLNVTPALKLVGFGSYLDFDSIDASDQGGVALLEDSGNAWVAGANAVYTLTPGLTVGAEVAYSKHEFDDFDLDEGDESEWTGGVRIKRVF